MLAAFGLELVTTGDAPELPADPDGCAAYDAVYSERLAAGADGLLPNRFFDDAASRFTAPACAVQYRPGTSGAWTIVAKSTGPAAEESLGYEGAAGQYRYVVQGLAGCGAYVLGFDQPCGGAGSRRTRRGHAKGALARPRWGWARAPSRV